jgi:hypothetical protein
MSGQVLMAPLEILFQGRAISRLEIKEVPPAGCLLNIMVRAEGETNDVKVTIVSHAPWLLALSPECVIREGSSASVSLRIESSLWEKPGEYRTELEFLSAASNDEKVIVEVCARYRTKKVDGYRSEEPAPKETCAATEGEFRCRECGALLPDKRPYCSVCRKKKAAERREFPGVHDEAERVPRHMVHAEKAPPIEKRKNMAHWGGLIAACVVFLSIALLMIVSFGGVKPHGTTSATGSLSLVTDPPDAWVIFLDGEFPMMKTPLSIDSLKAGSHKIHLKKDSCSDGNKLRELIINPNQMNAYSFKLDKLGSLVVQSLPSECEIFIDGQGTGRKTPAVIDDMVVGTHEVAVITGDAGAPRRTFAVEIQWKERQNLFAIMERAKSGLLIHCDGVSKVYMDGSFLGKTPLELKILGPGCHMLTVIKAGCVPWKTSLNFTEGEVAELTVVPLPLGRLALEGDTGAALYIDGQFIGSPPRTITRPPDHRFKLKAVSAGGQVWQKEIALLPGQFRKETISFPRMMPPPPSAPPLPDHRGRSMSEGYAPGGGFFDFSLADKFPPREWRVSQTVIDDIDNDGTQEMILALLNTKKKSSSGGFPVHLYIIKRVSGTYDLIPLRQPPLNCIGSGELYGLSINRVDDFGYREIEYVCGDTRGRITSQGAFIIHRGEAYNPRWCARKLE